jgi:hypothetical protein
MMMMTRALVLLPPPLTLTLTLLLLPRGAFVCEALQGPCSSMQGAGRMLQEAG